MKVEDKDNFYLLAKEIKNNFDVTNNLIVQLENEIICLIKLVEKLREGKE